MRNFVKKILSKAGRVANQDTNQQIKDFQDSINGKIEFLVQMNQSTKEELLVDINRNQDKKALPTVKQEIVNKENYMRLKKVNLGCGPFTKQGYINVDARKLKDVDLVADVADLPFEKESLDEIYAAHLIEHFTESEFIKIFKFWFSLVKSQGKLIFITPNIDVMITDYVNGTTSWENLRKVVFGAQDYQGDFHFNMFSTKYLEALIKENCKNSKIKFNAVNRQNGLCKELEIEITKI